MFRHRVARKLGVVGAAVLTACLVLTACGGDDADSLTVYSGRNENLVGPLLEQFSEETGLEIKVRYAKSAAIVATLLEEGENTPADVVFLQDAGALGALGQEGFLDSLSPDVLDKVDRRFRSPEGLWVGTSGRARTVVYNVETIDPATDLPETILAFTDPSWKGRIGWAPSNGSFQAFVTALRVQVGDAAARDWLKGIVANDPVVFPNNTTTVRGTADGEVDVGFVNHYYLHRFLKEEGESFGARNKYLVGGDPGAMVNVAGVGIVSESDKKPLAEQFVAFLLGQKAQHYVAVETFEFPLIAGVASPAGVPPLSTLDPPDIDLGKLADLKGTLNLLRDVGALE